MPKNNNFLKDSFSNIEKVEKQLKKVLAEKKEKIEIEPQERIKQDKKRAKRRLNSMKAELELEKNALKNYQETIAEYEKNKENLKDKLKDYIEQLDQNHSKIEKLADFHIEKLREARELNEQLKELHLAAEDKTVILKKKLKERFGIEPKVLETSQTENKASMDFDQEQVKMIRIKEILGSYEALTPESVEEETQRVENEQSQEVQEIEEVLSASIPEEEGVREGESQPEEEQEKRDEKGLNESEESRDALQADTLAEAESSSGGEEETEETVDILENYRNFEIIDENETISYFRSNGKIIFDGEYLIAAINNTLEKVGKLYQELSQADSPRDQFFLKQDILNNQEIVKHLVLKSVERGKQKSYSFPEYTSKIVNAKTLGEVLEKLSIQNWSNEDEFKDFTAYFGTLRDTFYKKITPPEAYNKSILQALSKQISSSF